MTRKFFERLPTNVTPNHYSVGLTTIDLESHEFEGRVVIKIVVNQATKSIKLNASELVVLPDVIFRSDGDKHHINAIEVKLNADDEIVDILFESPLEVGKGMC